MFGSRVDSVELEMIEFFLIFYMSVDYSVLEMLVFLISS